MATKTTNYSLTKPEMVDTINQTIPDLAGNMDKIDTEFKNQDDRIDNIIAQSGTSDTEVVDARSSTTKSKTFTVLDGRLEETEQDVKNRVTHAEAGTIQIENIGYGVQNGLNVETSSTPDMNVHVQTGAIYMPDGLRFEFSTITSIAIIAADATNPRKDIIYVDSVGSIKYTAGTPATSPSEPALPIGSMKLSVIDIPAGDTAISQTQITDSRIMKKVVAYQADLYTKAEVDDLLEFNDLYGGVS
jgi:hypothetical protein